MKDPAARSDLPAHVQRSVHVAGIAYAYLQRAALVLVALAALAVPLAAWQALEHGTGAKFGRDALPVMGSSWWQLYALLLLGGMLVRPAVWLIGVFDAAAQIVGRIFTGELGQAVFAFIVCILLIACYPGVRAARRWFVYLVRSSLGLPAERVRILDALKPQGSAGAAPDAKGVLYPARRPTLKFSDLHGMAALKERLLEAGREALGRDPKTRNGMLLHGKPGNGKTVLAEALAGELGVRFVAVSIADLKSRWVGQTTEQLVAAFRSAQAQAPCVLLLDEVDSVIASREHDGSQEGPDTTNAFLTEVVRARGSGVVVVAATNFLSKLDTAAIREGRFDFKIEVTGPDLEARKGLLQDCLGSARLHATPEVLDMVARRWSGFSVSRVMAVGREVVNAARQAGVTTVDAQAFLLGLRTVQARTSLLPEDCPSLRDLQLKPETAEALQNLVWRMSSPFEAEALGASTPDGVLFYGPSGTGKTTAVKALARETGWALFEASGDSLVRDPVRIATLYAQAADARPSIILIDEADDILVDRALGQYAGAANTLLSVMGGVGGKVPDVLFIATTNHPESVDPAMLRGGRFTEKIAFETPDDDRIEEAVREWLASKGWSCSADMALVRERLSGLPIATVKAVLQHAVNAIASRIAGGKSGPRDIDLGALDQALKAVALHGTTMAQAR